MKAILLAAGKGTRISRHLDGKPKCTVDLGNGKKLIEHTIRILKSNGIHEIAIVTGYQHQIIESLLSDQGIQFFYNPFYDVTNSIASLWFAKDFFNTSKDVLIMNADVFAEESVYRQVFACKKNPVFVYDSSRKEEADYKFYCPNGVIEKYGKQLAGNDISGEYVGMALIQEPYISQFVSHLNEMISEQKHDLWWENVFYDMSATNDIFVEDINGKFWAEVDYIEDYSRIKDYINSKMIELEY